MGTIISVKQVKITCKKKFVGVIENIDRFNRKKLNGTIAKYIFYVKNLDSASFDTQEEADAWKAEHPDIIGANVKTCIKDAVDNCSDAYIYMPDLDDGENICDVIYACNIRIKNGTNYGLRNNYFSLVIENGIVKFNTL